MKKHEPLRKKNPTRNLAPSPKINRSLPELKDFTYSEFKKIADKAPFTQVQWAAILHVSERTLQRYAKGNGQFAPINAERALQIQKLLNEGAATFGDSDRFLKWLNSNNTGLEGIINFECLTTNEGINIVHRQLGRIQHGVIT
jgi:putative toxin-antitoxin system antitoxin component (TIGR02293 family)